LPARVVTGPAAVDLILLRDPVDEIVATLLYPATHLPFREIYEQVSAWSAARKREVIDVALEGRSTRDELSREFRSGYAFLFDIVTDIGAYRDLHRHRRCQQIRQEFSPAMGAETPAMVEAAGLSDRYQGALGAAWTAAERVAQVSPEAARYLLPFATRLRCLFKMDFAEAEYIARVRSGVKGHFSYRDIAWKMKEKLVETVPELGRLVEATPPWIEDALTR